MAEKEILIPCLTKTTELYLMVDFFLNPVKTTYWELKLSVVAMSTVER